MEAIYFGSDVGWNREKPKNMTGGPMDEAPWIGADIENGMYMGDDYIGAYDAFGVFRTSLHRCLRSVPGLCKRGIRRLMRSTPLMLVQKRLAFPIQNTETRSGCLQMHCMITPLLSPRFWPTFHPPIMTSSTVT
jgi:hypothetical protein